MIVQSKYQEKAFLLNFPEVISDANHVAVA
jgi:hypothetical protein